MKTICFLGDSITQNGRWIAEVFENVKNEYCVFNCGIGGDRASYAIHRLFQTCMTHSPDTVVLMLGMNDVNTGLYAESFDKTDLDKKKEEALNIYRENMSLIAEKITSCGVELVLCTPTPFDDVHFPELEKNDANTGLAKAAEFVKELANKHSAKCIDFFSIMSNYMKEDKFRCCDRVHPDPDSEHVMAQVFMKEMGITEKIDIETPFVMSESNAKRFEVEQTLKQLQMPEYVFLAEYKINNPDHTEEEKIAEVKRLIQKCIDTKDEAYENWFTNYLKNSAQMPKLEGKLIELTFEMNK